MSLPTILVATDLSKRSVDIVQKAIPLAKKLDATLHIVHIVEDKLFDFFEEKTSLLEKASRALDDLFPDMPKEQLHCKRGKVAGAKPCRTSPCGKTCG